MTTALADIIETFAQVDPATRLELLLDYARRLPPLPDRFRAMRAAGVNRVHECMTPVFLFVGRGQDGRIAAHADVADEAPTVKGFVSIVLHGVHGATQAEVATIPADLVDRLGLADLLRMNRAVGLAAVLGRIKRDVAALPAST